ncbi:MAG: hypothetical protein WD063_14140 [Pirellulales bacterium]
MSRCGSMLLVMLAVLASGGKAHGQWFEQFKQNCKRDYHRNSMWPEPFLQADRNAVMCPFAIQTANGWRRQNLLSDYHFNEATNQLTLAGESKLRYVLTQMPPTRRTVFVQQGLSTDVTEGRMHAVERSAEGIVPTGMVANVVESNLPNEGWPAADIDAVTRKFIATTPDPRLPPGGISGGGSGSGGYDNTSAK